MFIILIDASKDSIARKLSLFRRYKRDAEEADSDQAKILKVISKNYTVVCYILQNLLYSCI